MKPFVVRRIKGNVIAVVVGETVRLDEPYWKVVFMNDKQKRQYSIWKKDMVKREDEVNIKDVLPTVATDNKPVAHVQNINTGAVAILMSSGAEDDFTYYCIKKPNGSDGRWKRDYCALISEEEYARLAPGQSEKKAAWNKGHTGKTKVPPVTAGRRKCIRCEKPIMNENRFWCSLCHHQVTREHPDYRSNMSDPG